MGSLSAFPQEGIEPVTSVLLRRGLGPLEAGFHRWKEGAKVMVTAARRSKYPVKERML